MPPEDVSPANGTKKMRRSCCCLYVAVAFLALSMLLLGTIATMLGADLRGMFSPLHINVINNTGQDISKVAFCGYEDPKHPDNKSGYIIVEGLKAGEDVSVRIACGPEGNQGYVGIQFRDGTVLSTRSFYPLSGSLSVTFNSNNTTSVETVFGGGPWTAPCNILTPEQLQGRTWPP